MHREIRIGIQGRMHSVYITSNKFESIGAYITSLFPEIWKSFVITDNRVYRLYGEKIMQSLERSGLNPGYIAVPCGEASKSLETVSQIYDSLNRHEIDRKSVILALGGGMIGDLGGFSAASYMRGIPFIHIPTTLLAQADSSIGGKTAVNYGLEKNKIGFFYYPIMVFCDVSALRSLSSRELSSGMAEAIRHGMSLDQDLFLWIEHNVENIKALDEVTMMELTYRSCNIKKSVIQKDPYDTNVRAILNFGHTVGHVLESLTEYKRYQHGEAVAIGMVLCSRLSNRMGMLENTELKRLIALLMKFGLPVTLPDDISAEAIIKAIKHDKKSIHGKVPLILPCGLGQSALVNEWKEIELLQVLEESMNHI